MIDITNSSIHFLGKENSWRSNVKSVLYSKDKSLILTKECRSEIISSLNPFDIKDKNEVMALVENDQIYIFRDTSVVLFKNNSSRAAEIKIIKIIKNLPEKKLNIIEFNKAHELITSNKIKNIICKIDYKLNNENFTLVSNCEYINYNTHSDHKKYLQPIIGYVPFIFKGEKKIAYAVCNLNNEKNSDIFFIIREETPLLSINQKSFVKNLIKTFLNTCLFFLKKSEFTKVVQLKDYKMSLFENS